MNTKIIIFFLIGVIISGSVAYVWAEDAYRISTHTECFEMWKIPKFDKFGNGNIVSCIDINPFGK